MFSKLSFIVHRSDRSVKSFVMNFVLSVTLFVQKSKKGFFSKVSLKNRSFSIKNFRYWNCCSNKSFKKIANSKKNDRFQTNYLDIVHERSRSFKRFSTVRFYFFGSQKFYLFTKNDDHLYIYNKDIFVTFNQRAGYRLYDLKTKVLKFSHI